MVVRQVWPRTMVLEIRPRHDVYSRDQMSLEIRRERNLENMAEK